MLRPGKKFYKRPSLVAATTVFLLALLTVPSNIVLTTRAESQSTSAGGDKPAGSLPELAVDTGPSFSNPTNLGPTVNSSDHEFDPSISADGLSLYFNSYRPGGSGEADIWVTTRKTTTDPWGTPVNLGTVVNSSTNDTAPDISADGLSLYFSSDRSGGDGARDLWVTMRETMSARWGTPVNLGSTVNSSGNDHGPSISADGLSLYFSGYAASGPFRSGGIGGGDLWVTTRKTKDDPWTEPVNLGPKVNYSGWDASPSISVDGLTLYFNSSRDGGFGGPDLWVTTRETTDDPWGNAVNLGPTVNSAESDMNPDISDDGSMLYFASARPGAVGDSDLWQVLFEKGTEASSLHSAAFTGALVKVKAFLDAGVNVNEKNDAGVTALYAAVIRGHKDVIELLLTKGADINASVMTNGRTPLHCATKADVAGFLIAKGADINAKDNEGRIPLHSFAKAGSKDVVELLIAKGADVNAKDNDGQTPLDIAVLRNHKDIVDLLTAKDADYSPQVAARLGLLEEITKLVKKGTDINIKDASGRTALHHAARAGHKEMVELLLANGADVNIGEKHYNRTAAEFAMRGNHKEVVELLISKGADISPLHFAFYMKDQVKAKSLIEGGADVNKRTPYGTTPLASAADAGFTDIAELLIDRGADVNAKDNWDWTPLHSAVYGHKDIAELLIANGANVNARDGGGRTPLWYAHDEGHFGIVELLRKHGAKD